MSIGGTNFLQSIHVEIDREKQFSWATTETGGSFDQTSGLNLSAFYLHHLVQHSRIFKPPTDRLKRVI
jgi:hypothetical protein